MRFYFLLLLLFYVLIVNGQIPDHIYKSSIRSVKLNKAGDIYGYPVIKLYSGDELDLVFDDLDADIKNYYYTYQLCNADWSNPNIHSFDFIKGFQSIRITNYRNSSIAFTRYTVYQARIPDRNCVPIKSGNYLLKVFLDGDTSKVVFTKRFLVIDTKASVLGQVLQPFNGSTFKTHQKLEVKINVQPQLNIFNQQDVKVIMMQNFNWASSRYFPRPDIFRGNYFEYNDESATSYEAGKEWRWIDLRSLRLMSERMTRIDKQPTRTDVYVKPDGERRNQVYLYYNDINGRYTIQTTDKVKPFWQSDNAYLHFSFFPAENKAYPGKNIYLLGELTNYALDDNSKLEFNAEKGAYEKTLFLKQGFYDYSYVTLPDKKGSEKYSFENTEGNYWATENSYQVLVYYRSFGGRSDELIGFSILNSLFHRTDKN